MKTLEIIFDKNGRIESQKVEAVGKSSAFFFEINFVIPEELKISQDADKNEIELQPLLYAKRPDKKSFCYLPEKTSNKFILDGSPFKIPGTVQLTLVLSGSYDTYTTTLASGEEVTTYQASRYPLQPFYLHVDENAYTEEPGDAEASNDLISVFGPRLISAENSIDSLMTTSSNHEARIFASEEGIYNHEGRLSASETELKNLKQTVTTNNDDLNKRIDDLVGGAPEAFDTLKEIADSLADNNSDTAKALISIADNKERLESQEEQLDTIEENLNNAISDNNNKFGEHLILIQNVEQLSADNREDIEKILASGVNTPAGEALKARLDNFEKSKADKTDLDSLKAESESLAERVLNAETVNVSQGADLTSLDSRIDAIEDAKSNNTLYKLPNNVTFNEVTVGTLKSPSGVLASLGSNSSGTLASTNYADTKANSALSSAKSYTSSSIAPSITYQYISFGDYQRISLTKYDNWIKAESGYLSLSRFIINNFFGDVFTWSGSSMTRSYTSGKTIEIYASKGILIHVLKPSCSSYVSCSWIVEILDSVGRPIYRGCCSSVVADAQQASSQTFKVYIEGRI